MRRFTVQPAMLLAFGLAIVAGCWNLDELQPYDAGSGTGTDTDTDSHSEKQVTTYHCTNSGMGQIETSTVRGWVVVGHGSASQTIETPSYRIGLGIGPVLGNQKGGDP